MSSFKSEQFKLFYSDGASYMRKAGCILKELYPCLRHLTCLCHALQNVYEELMRQFPNVNTLISVTKKIFLKSPKRVARFHERYPDLKLPPEPMVIRFGFV